VAQRLFAKTTGDGAETIVLLHGFGGSHAVWRDIQASLSDWATIIAYDLPGHGGSLDWPDAGPAKIAVRAILADLAERGLARVHLAGHSMGGAIATLMAMAEPDRVASLSLFSPGGFGEEINGRLLAAYAAARDTGGIRAALEAMSGWSHAVSDQAVASLLSMRAAAGQTGKLIDIAKIISNDGRQGMIPRERLAALAMPVSVAWGTLDPVLPYHQAADLPPRFGLHRVSGAGHMLIEEATELVVELIRQKLRRPG
jgi:pyruvate dehydrogenase E2 component (dihydrolipoamide acetyltransferase)